MKRTLIQSVAIVVGVTTAFSTLQLPAKALTAGEAVARELGEVLGQIILSNIDAHESDTSHGRPHAGSHSPHDEHQQGYQDGLHHRDYNNRHHTHAYDRGFIEGVEAANLHRAHRSDPQQIDRSRLEEVCHGEISTSLRVPRGRIRMLGVQGVNDGIATVNWRITEGRSEGMIGHCNVRTNGTFINYEAIGR